MLPERGREVELRKLWQRSGVEKMGDGKRGIVCPPEAREWVGNGRVEKNREKGASGRDW